MTERDLFCYRDAKRVLARAVERLSEIDALMGDPPTQRLDGIPGGGGMPSNPVAHAVELRERAVGECRRAQNRVVEAWQTLDRVDALLDDAERLYVHYRYRCCLRPADIPGRMHYTKRTTERIRARILMKIRYL